MGSRGRLSESEGDFLQSGELGRNFGQVAFVLIELSANLSLPSPFRHQFRSKDVSQEVRAPPVRLLPTLTGTSAREGMGKLTSLPSSFPLFLPLPSLPTPSISPFVIPGGQLRFPRVLAP